MSENKKFDVTYWYSFATGTSDCDDYNYDTFKEFLDDLDRIDCYSGTSCGRNINLSRNGKTISLDPEEWKELRDIIKNKDEKKYKIPFFGFLFV